VMISGMSDSRKIVQASFQYSQILENDFATYPLLPVQEAWNNLLAGKGYIAKKITDKVTVRRITLAYFESNQPQKFLQPVYLFEGDAGFMAYVQAVDPKMVIE